MEDLESRNWFLQMSTEEQPQPTQVPAALTGPNSEERNTPSPIDPEAIEVDINFQPDPTDLVLSSVPGGELFNPRKHKFSEDELKPQPMIKKAKKVFVPDDQKVAYCSIINIINMQTDLRFFHPHLFALFFIRFFPGWQILVQEEEEQCCSQTFSRRTQAKGEPDHSACFLPRTGKRCAAAASGRTAEGLGPQQEHFGPIWGEIRPTVRNPKTKEIPQPIHETSEQNSLPRRT